MNEALKSVIHRNMVSRLGIGGQSKDTNVGTLDGSNLLKFSGDRVEELTSKLEKAIFDRDEEGTQGALDSLLYLLELQVERMVDAETALKALSWRISVLRLMATRSQIAILRMPGLIDSLFASEKGVLNVIQRQLTILGFFSDLTRQKMSLKEFTPEIWLKADPSISALRVNLGVAYYHLGRIQYAKGPADGELHAKMKKVFDSNFDVMFYALTYGPMFADNSPVDYQDLLKRHFEVADAFISGPQPAIGEDPELYAIPKMHVLHVLTTVDRVRETLPLLSD